MHDPWIERLSEYLDEGVSRSDREALEQHLLRCRECASTVEELTAVRKRARNLTEARVPAELWSRIESSIAAGRVRSLPSPEAARGQGVRGSGREGTTRSFRGGRVSFSLPQLVAASLAGAGPFGGGGVAWVGGFGKGPLSPPSGPPTPPNGTPRGRP